MYFIIHYYIYLFYMIIYFLCLIIIKLSFNHFHVIRLTLLFIALFFPLLELDIIQELFTFYFQFQEKQVVLINLHFILKSNFY